MAVPAIAETPGQLSGPLLLFPQLHHSPVGGDLSDVNPGLLFALKKSVKPQPDLVTLCFQRVASVWFVKRSFQTLYTKQCGPFRSIHEKIGARSSLDGCAQLLQRALLNPEMGIVAPNQTAVVIRPVRDLVLGI